MLNIKSFIELGWHTVPLRGSLERLEDGSKTIPTFEKGWREKYTEQHNTIAAKLGGTITGKVSGIIAIDCDNDVTYELFKSLDPEYEFEFVSKGKLNANGEEKKCGTLVYEYDEEYPDTFSIADGLVQLDVYSDAGFVYLPTDANKTKVAWSGRLPKLKQMPAATKVLLKQLQKTKQAPSVNANAAIPDNVLTANCLAPLVRQFTESRKFMPGLFKILTPKAFRTEPQYVKQGFLHPENVPAGRGSEYLVKVSAILGADVSIDEELYASAMHDINDLWPEPMDADRLDNTILAPMMEGKSSIDGRAIWNYDENWSQYRCVLHSKRQSALELGFDDRRDMYYCVDAANEQIKAFARDNELFSYLTSAAINTPKKAELKNALPIINVTADPSKDFGFNADDDPTARTLNTFVRTPELSILMEPAPYAQFYKKPDTILRYFETLVPEEKMRTFLLRFLKRKLTTFDYSPIVLYFMGVPGSGKDTFVGILEEIMGKMARPTTKEFLEMFNGWLLDSYFVQLDEYGNQLTSVRDREEALGKLKAYTGKQNVQIRQMRTDGFTYAHNATFIMTANRNPLMLEDGDRRVAFFPTPNVLAEAPWVQDITEVHDQIHREIKDFAYYLATQVEALTGTEYVKPPESAHKHRLIADSMYAAQKIAYVLKYHMMDYLDELAQDYGSPKIRTAIRNRRITTADMEELYDLLTDYNGDMRSLNKAIRSAGIEVKASSKHGDKIYYYHLENFENEFDADEEEVA